MMNHVELISSSLCDYSDAYIIVSATITVPNTAAAGATASNRKNIIIKNCAPFTNCISEINNTQTDNAKDLLIFLLIIIIVLCLNLFKTASKTRNDGTKTCKN